MNPLARDDIAAGVRVIARDPIDPGVFSLPSSSPEVCPDSMFAIDRKDPTPLHAQLDRAIRVAIATGRLNVGDRLPTVRQMAVDLKINANTVAKVYGELERFGVLETRRGVGTFIRQDTARATSPPDRERMLSELADGFLAGSAALGFSADEAINFLRAHCRWMAHGGAGPARSLCRQGSEPPSGGDRT